MRWRLLTITLFTTLATAVVCGAFFASSRWTEQKIAASWRQQIAAADEPTARRLIQQLAELEEPALPHLVGLLGDRRPAVRSAARQSLDHMMQQWRERPGPPADRCAARLARELALCRLPEDPESRTFIQRTARQLLHWPVDEKIVDHLALVDNCAAALQRSLGGSIAAPSDDEGETVMDAFEAAIPDPPASPLSYGDLIAPSPPPLPIEEPAFQFDPSIAEDEPPTTTHPPIASMPPEAPSLEPLPHIPAVEQQGDKVAPPLRFNDEAFASLPARALMRQLQGVPETAAAAERELRRRGCNDATLQLARQLDDPDVSVRLELVNTLSRSDRDDAAAWLWELASDDSPQVAQAARNVLHTSRNPLTRQRLSSQPARQHR